MRMISPRVVISGVGVVSPFGLGYERFCQGLLEQRLCAAPVRQFDASTFPTTIAAEVPHFALDAGFIEAQLAGALTDAQRALLLGYQRRLELRDRKLTFALLAAHEAAKSASLDLSSRADMSLSLGLGLERAFLEDFDALWAADKIDWSKTPEAWEDQTRIRSQVSLPSARVAEFLGIRGPRSVNVSACAASALAIAQGAAWIKRGMAERVLCGGADAMINPLGLGGMARLGAPSPRAEADACRPFDRDRDGLLMGEGAAMFILERVDVALSRGVRPLATVLGWGCTQDGWRTTAPREDGQQAALAMQRALLSASIRPEQLDYINAHGTGTPLNDPAESRAILSALGQAHGARVPVSSIKGAIGHWMAACGAAEAAACLLPLTRGIAPGTANLVNQDQACPIHVIGPAPIALEATTALSSSFGFGGQNVALLFGRWT